ncbi:MAG: DUF2867 domain-containing protein [Gemmatimonas sp.]|nr:DUF2867 domain-containing protein [Gemmatimonas sp.]
MGGPGQPGQPETQGDSGPLYVGAGGDGWRVAAFTPSRHRPLRAATRRPGWAWLEFRAEPDGAAAQFIRGARFVPAGVFGHLNWFVMVPAPLLLSSALATARCDRAAAGRASDAREWR